MHPLGGPKPISLEGIRWVDCTRPPKGCGDNWRGVIYRGDDIERRVAAHVNKKFAAWLIGIRRDSNRVIL